VVIRPASPPPPSKQGSNPLARRSSGRNSQTVALLKELDSARNRNAWYASELELARKAGYSSNASLSPILDSRAAESFDDEDRPLIEALLAMRAELANVQSSVDKQAVLAAKQIAEAEKQRDAAIQEAVYAKAKFAAHVGGSGAQVAGSGRDSDELNRKLAVALHTQQELQGHLDRMVAELEAERRARKLADDTVGAAQRRMTDLEGYKQQNSQEMERLRGELHAAQRSAREQSVAAAEAVAAAQMLRVEKDEFQTKYKTAVGSSKASDDTFASLREAIASSAETKGHLERRLEEERSSREKIESKLNKLKTEHESRTAELVAATQRLRDAEALAEKHAAEARTHHKAILSGLDKVSARDVPGQSNSKVDADRIAALQGQLTSANALVKKYQQEADTASDRLRSAEERIAGLEAYQEQASREGVTIRRQLQTALKDTQTLQASNAELKQKLASQQLDTNAMAVQHNTLKDILTERGISPTAVSKARGSPREASPEQQSKMRELEQQLQSARSAHEETKQNLVVSEGAYRDKLSQLENDYSSAVHYVKGTEKMLKQLKDQLAKYKAENTKLKAEIETLEERGLDGGGGAAPTNWEAERSSLTQHVDALQSQMQATKAELESQLLAVRRQLDDVKRERDVAVNSTEEAASRLMTSRRDFEQLQSENALLERRAQDAEQKVGMLLDQVETSVGNYRRRSRQVASMNSDQLRDAAGVSGISGVGVVGGQTLLPAGGNTNGGGAAHVRQDSSEAGSVYGSIGDARNSAALDSLANELETLRSQWETNSKNYRLSNTFDFDSNVTGVTAKGKEDDAGLSESLADWRKRLDG
jgi:chromosome segregation ATPase